MTSLPRWNPRDRRHIGKFLLDVDFFRVEFNVLSDGKLYSSVVYAFFIVSRKYWPNPRSQKVRYK